MVRETDTGLDASRGEAAREPVRLRRAWGLFKIVLAIVVFVFFYVRSLDPAVSERKAMRRGDVELLQTLQAGDDTYTLHYVRSGAQRNTVNKNGQRVFDGREADTMGCIRLRRRDDGVVELECQHINRRDAIFLPMP